MTLDERLLAYVDGELSGDELAKFEAEMAANPRLKDEVEKHRGLNARLAAARAARAELTGRNAGKGAKTAKAAKAGAMRPSSPRVRVSAWTWLAILGGLSIGIAGGLAAGRYAWPEPGPLIAANGMLTSAGDLNVALTNQFTDQKGPITIGQTFRTAKGRYCRTFRSTTDRLAGLACRQSDGWVMQTTTILGQPGVMPRAVLAAADGLIVGAPLDEAAERAARAKDWRSSASSAVGE